MNPARRQAMKRQRDRGNAPDQTRRTDEVRRDHGYYSTGVSYRRRLEDRLKEAE